MPPKKQKPVQTATATTPTSRKNPDRIPFLKFRSDPKPNWPLKSCNSLMVLRDRIRTSMWDPDLPIITKEDEKDKGKVQDKDKDKGKVNIEILFKNIEQVDVMSTKPDKKTLIVHTSKPIESVKGHVLSNSLVFYFSAESNKMMKGELGGIEDFMKMWKSLESRGVEIVRASSATPPGSGIEQMDEDNDDDAASNVIVTPTPANTRKRGPGSDANPFEDPLSGPASTATSLLEGEMVISSSQPARRKTPKASTTRAEQVSEEEVDDEQTPPSRKRLKVKTAGNDKRGQDMDADLKRPQAQELAKCLQDLFDLMMKNFDASHKKAGETRKHLESKLWKAVRSGVERSKEQSLVVAGNLEKGEARFQLHGKQYSIIIGQNQGKMEFYINRLKETSKTITDQRRRLLELKSPFQKERIHH